MAFLLKGVHAVDPQLNLDKVVDVLIDGKTIAKVADDIEKSDGDEVIDGSGKYLVPGLVDMHVHFRDPGFEYKETIETGSRAATHGGFTDAATMPNTDPVTDTGTGVSHSSYLMHLLSSQAIVSSAGIISGWVVFPIVIITLLFIVILSLLFCALNITPAKIRQGVYQKSAHPTKFKVF